LLADSDVNSREDRIQILISNLGTQIKAQYDSNKIGQDALTVVGNMRIVRG
jgi:hypothetical protein